ncbi:uncharacterized protein V1513DRAFT_443990 [Lipomyces chichibuensis]|uniref:uncharacterized protein n=1 Tax=Lipomyces chichibuensis TaxID=1546026 RepID=UPI0033430305
MAPTASAVRRSAFKVPASMPDGVHKRKLEKIKKTLSHNADVKRSYRKTLNKMGFDVPPPLSRKNGVKQAVSDDADGLHEDTEQNAEHSFKKALQKPTGRHNKKPKLSRFNKEEAVAATLRAEREAAQEERARREADRQQKIEKRQKNKQKMTQYTRTGQPKLGVRVGVLLDKIQKTT